MQIPAWWEQEYIWVDLVRGSRGYPAGYASQTDPQGFANTPDAPFKTGGVAPVPRTYAYGGYYVLTGKGEGQIRINPFNTESWIDIPGATVTQGGVTFRGGHNYSSFGSRPPGGIYNVTDTGSGWRIIVQRIDRGPYQELAWSAPVTRQGNYIRDFHIYRIDDEPDFIAGNWFNKRFKQTLVDLNPCALRFMNWTTGSGHLWRWRDRTPPSYFSNWGDTNNWKLLRYPSASCPESKAAYVVAAVPETPATYRHGEIVFCGMPNDFSTAQGTKYSGDHIIRMVFDTSNPAHAKVTPLHGGIGTLGVITGGSGGPAGPTTYNNVKLTTNDNENRWAATANISVARGSVTAVDITSIGEGYSTSGPASVMSAKPADIGGVNGFSVPITTLACVYKAGDQIQFYGTVFNYRVDFMIATIQRVGVDDPISFTVDIDMRPFSAAFTGSSAGTNLTVSSVTGTILIGSTVTGKGVPQPPQAAATTIVSQTFGTPEGAGVYVTSQATTANGDRLGTAACESGQFAIHTTLNVGGRGAAPIRFPAGGIPVTRFGQGYLHGGPGSMRPFVYDKNVAASRDANGKLTFGAWICLTATGETVRNYQCPVGIEYCLKLINELEDMIVAQGLQAVKGPINPWINVNCYAMLSTDPDYNEADHVGIGMAQVMLNGNPSLGIKGMPSRCDLFVEYSNETWNLPGGFWVYSCAMSSWRWGNSVVGYNDDSDSTVLRAVQLSVDLKTAFPDDPRIKMIMGGWETWGISGYPNHNRVFGTPTLLGDSPGTAATPPGAKPVYYGTSHGGKVPITFFWGFATAPYLDPSGNWEAAHLTPSVNAWIANGQKTIASVSQSYPAVVTTTTHHGFSNGDMAVFTNLVWSGNGTGWNQINISLFGEVSKLTDTTFNMAIDSTAMARITSGKVTRINGPDQEAVYNSYLQWMVNQGDSSQDLNSIHARCQAYSAALVPHGVFHVNYEGWEEMPVTVSQSGYTDAIGFVGACKQSQAMASMMTAFLNNKKNVYGSYMPSAFTQLDPGRWGFTFPNSYGFAVNGVEWSGLSKSWRAMCEYNATAATKTIRFSFSR